MYVRQSAVSRRHETVTKHTVTKHMYDTLTLKPTTVRHVVNDWSHGRAGINPFSFNAPYRAMEGEMAQLKVKSC
eukprot:1064236-Pleurochrysis_carterae.AAC.2